MSIKELENKISELSKAIEFAIDEFDAGKDKVCILDEVVSEYSWNYGGDGDRISGKLEGLEEALKIINGE